MNAPRELDAHLPIAILSFDRPAYLRQVLDSLRPQVTERDPIILFQDGAINAYSGQRRGDPDDIRACVEIFRKLIPWGITSRSEGNIGIAENYERAEQYVFRGLNANAGLFLEDDMVLAPGFFTVTRRLLSLAARDRRIAYVSAYGNFWASLAEQTSRQSELIHMHENWGAAITRGSWLDERPFREAYLALVRGVDYTQRDNVAVRKFYQGRGWNVDTTSQDAARWVASVELGKVRLTSFSCHARYIGRRGVHFTEAHYDACGFGEAQMFDAGPPMFDMPTDAQFATWLDMERRRFLGSGDTFYPHHPTGAESSGD